MDLELNDLIHWIQGVIFAGGCLRITEYLVLISKDRDQSKLYKGKIKNVAEFIILGEIITEIIDIVQKYVGM